ncbi:MAG: Spy/CpxP family protein refolding chaperone [Candidatus Krumholzibacteria bacterium]|nr:Spy/CpxP family protein refolding chaperone [Candidatus Krumholzibacteria bacterium]
MKTRNNTFMVSALVALLVVGLTAPAMAQGPGQGQGQGRNGKGNGQSQGEFGPQMQVERMAKRLDLSADQITAIKEIRASGRIKNMETRKQVMRLRNEKHGEMLKDDPSTKKVLELTTEIGNLRTKMQTNRMSNRLEVRKVLTPEQRDKMLLSGDGRGDKRGDKRGQKFGQGNNRGQGGGGCNNDCDSPRRENGSGHGNW